MKRRDFLKIGVATVIVAEVAKEAAGKTVAVDVNTATGKTAVAGRDWSVKFQSVTAHITKNTFRAFYNMGCRNRRPEDFLDYLLSGTSLPRCENVGRMVYDDDRDIVAVTFTDVVFASNTRQHPSDFFAGYEHSRFCLSSPDAKSGTYLTFSKKAVSAAEAGRSHG